MLRILLIIISFLFISLSACSEKEVPDPEDTVVATVGDMEITVRDFRRNYEFGLPHLKKEPDRKRSYLNYMIKELVLAQEGYELNLDKSERVQKLEHELEEELLVEALFQNEVKDNIDISDEEVHEAINRSKVQWKMRFWYEPDLEYAKRVTEAMREQGYARVVENILRNNPEIKIKPENFETKYVTWLEVDPLVLEIIKDLPMGEISDPVKLKNGYFIFQVVDIQRQPVTDYIYQERAESIRQVLFYRKLNQEAVRYVSDMMTPKNVTTKGEAFQKLSSALKEWQKIKINKKEDFISSVLSARESDGSSLYELKKSLEQPLVTFDDNHWTIREFLDRFDPKSIKMNPKNKDMDIRPALKDNIGIAVRNEFMIREAKERNLQKSPKVIEELQRWRDKWVYEETRSYHTKDIKIDDKRAREYFEMNKDKFKIRWDDNPQFEKNIYQAKRLAYIEMTRNRLTETVDSLTNKKIPIIINEAVLDTITTIDSQKSRWSSLQVFKRGTNRLANPVVDPAWGF